MRLKLISCEVLFRELCYAVSRSPHIVDIEFLPKGLHDIGCSGMLARLQAALDNVDAASYDAVLFGYGLCNNGIAGLKAGTIPVVIPRAHDCMTLFLGSKERYLDHFNQNPGTYYLTSGWLERGESTGELRQLSIPSQNGMDMTYEQLVEKYGEDNAKFLYDQLYNQTRHYRKMTFIEMGIEPDDRFRKAAEEKAAEHKLEFSQVRGDMGLLQNLVDGLWDPEKFLVVKPGWQVMMDYTENVISAEPVTA
jgi:Protein of unknown function (DUF1638)